MSKTCQDCMIAKRCLRRDHELSEGMIASCARTRHIAARWDQRFGIIDDTVEPTSFSLPEIEAVPRKPKRANISSRSDRPRTSRGRRPARAEYEGERGLGDMAESAFKSVGITQERADKVAAWFGVKCGCAERKEKWNKFGQWAKNVLSGETAGAEEALNDMING